jgi:hypothetical protein
MTNGEPGQGTIHSDWTLNEEWATSRLDRYDTMKQNTFRTRYIGVWATKPLAHHKSQHSCPEMNCGHKANM